MSRYLVQLARETRSKLRPPAGFRIAPRAPAIFDEVHEERPAPIEHAAHAVRELRGAPLSSTAEVSPPPRIPPGFDGTFSAPAPRILERPVATFDVARHETPIPSPLRPMPETHAATSPTAPVNPLAKFAEPPIAHQSAARRQPVETPKPVSERPSQPAALTKPENRRAPETQTPSEAADERIEHRVRTMSFLFDENQPLSKPSKISQPELLQTARTRLQAETPQPAYTAPRVYPLAPAAPRTPPQPPIEVTIGTVEVIVESEPQPPARVARRPEPRVAPPRSAPPMPGGLARQYLDR
jgi:hypothetical protein